jgi:hypothetical protein
MTFTPIPPSPIVITATAAPTNTFVLPSATLPVVTATLPALPTITNTPQPAILNVTPNTGQVGTTINVTITGTGFANGAVVLFEGGQGTAPQVMTTQVVNPTTIVATVNVPVNPGFGTQQWDLRVTNPNTSSAFLADAFTAVAP